MSLSRRTLALVALLSGLATALVVHVGLADTTAQKAARAALEHPQTVTAIRRGETIIALAPTTVTHTSQDIAPPLQDTPPAVPETTPAVSVAPAATQTTTTATATTPTNTGLPKVGHVFVVSLSTASFKDAFATSSAATYLHSLLPTGTLLTGYRSLGHGELADQLAALSGQAPNPDTTAGCPKYVAFPATAVAGADGTVPGRGCIYPSTTLSLADQITNAGKQWGAYVEGMGTTPCPTPQTNGSETAAIAGTDADYDTIHNPFIFFPSLTGSGACYLDEGDTDAKLPTVLGGSATATPALTYVAPAACADGARSDIAAAASATTTATTPVPSTTTAISATTTDAALSTTTAAAPGVTAVGTTTTAPTANATTTAGSTSTGTITTGTTTTGTSTTSTEDSSTAAGRDDLCASGQASGIPAEDAFLSTWIPQILASKAYKANGVLIIAFSGVTPSSGAKPYSSGVLVISRWTSKNKRLAAAYSPYSLLHSIEDMFDLQPLAEAADAPAFAQQVL